eukprot:UN27191
MSELEYSRREKGITDQGMKIVHKEAGNNWWTYRSDYLQDKSGSYFINVEVKDFPKNSDIETSYDWSNVDNMLFGHTMYGWRSQKCDFWKGCGNVGGKNRVVLYGSSLCGDTDYKLQPNSM